MLSISRKKIAGIFSRSMSTPRVLAFFCSSFSFNDLWLFMVYIRFVLNPANQKNTCFNDIDFRVMQRFTENKRLRAIGMLPSWIVTKHCR